MTQLARHAPTGYPARVTQDRYGRDVLAAGWQRQHITESVKQPMQVGMVIEDKLSGWCGAITRWENGLVVLEDRHGKKRSFPIGKGFLLEGKPVELTVPPAAAATRRHTASGSLATPGTHAARVALPSRIYVEGRHDAELVEKVWGDDLRHVGVVVEYMNGMDDLVDIVAEFQPGPGRRLGVLVDHLVENTKETRVVEQVRRGKWGDYVFITGHRFVDIWAAVKAQRVGLEEWPEIPRTIEWKKGICAALGWPHEDQADIARAWQRILGQVRSWKDLDPKLLTEVERLIDFVTQDHLEQ